MNYQLYKMIQMNLPVISACISECGGILINEQSCATESFFVVRCHPCNIDLIVVSLQNLGIVTGEVINSGMQTIIYIRGFML